MKNRSYGLDQAQIHFFKTFGYIVLRAFLGSEDRAIMGRELDEGLAG